MVAVPFAAGIHRHGEPLPHHLAHSPQRKESYLPQWAVHNHGVASGNFLTCYGLRFVEQRPVDQSGTWGGLILGDNARAPYLAACDAVAAAPLISWVMSPSSGQAIIWCWLNQQSGSGLLRGRALTCRAARLYPRALTGLQKRQSPGEYRGLGFVGVALRRCDRGTDAMQIGLLSEQG